MITPFPQERIDAIVLEVEAAQMRADEEMMRQKMAGSRCFTCDTWLGLPTGTTRYCGGCHQWLRDNDG